jgi:hypothetical protein
VTTAPAVAPWLAPRPSKQAQFHKKKPALTAREALTQKARARAQKQAGKGTKVVPVDAKVPAEGEMPGSGAVGGTGPTAEGGTSGRAGKAARARTRQAGSAALAVKAAEPKRGLLQRLWDWLWRRRAAS